MLSSISLSLLDRSRTRVGEPPGRALVRTVERAARAERLGFERYWVAEHHGVPGVASGSPPILIAAIAAATQSIRVGSGGVMLPNHQPFVIAEQFLMLEALHPGRIDLGVGRSLGFTAPVRQVLRQQEHDTSQFGEDLRELRQMLHGTGLVTAQPALVRAPPLFVLATGEGLAVAAEARLPVVVGGPALRNTSALREYRERAGSAAHVTISIDIMVAETPERAQELLLPEAWAMVNSRDTGSFDALESIDSVKARQLTDRQARAIRRWRENAVHGDAPLVRQQLEDLIDRTSADEVLATTSTYDGRDLAEADTRLARLFGVTQRSAEVTGFTVNHQA